MEKEKELGRPPKKLKVNTKLINKIANLIYRLEEVDSVSIEVEFKNGDTISCKKDESKDTYNVIEKEIEEDIG